MKQASSKYAGMKLMKAKQRGRRGALRGAFAALGGAVLAGCDKLSNNESFVGVLKSAENLSHGAQKVVAGRRAMAQEFTQADVPAQFRSNGTLNPADADYKALLKNGFADYRLEIGGLVEVPFSLSLAEIRALPSRTQITRHDCVEGWSCIGKWKGTPLGAIIDRAKPKPNARFVVFHCFDSMDDPSNDDDSHYYESIDLDEAHHVQTILAYELNDVALPVSNGAPLRCRVERQLGYKQAKYVRSIELVESFADLRGGNGGYWEDEGYEWYGGI